MSEITKSNPKLSICIRAYKKNSKGKYLPVFSKKGAAALPAFTLWLSERQHSHGPEVLKIFYQSSELLKSEASV